MRIGRNNKGTVRKMTPAMGKYTLINTNWHIQFPTYIWNTFQMFVNHYSEHIFPEKPFF